MSIEVLPLFLKQEEEEEAKDHRQHIQRRNHNIEEARVKKQREKQVDATREEPFFTRRRSSCVLRGTTTKYTRGKSVSRLNGS